MRKLNQPKVVDSYRTSPIGTQKTKKKKKKPIGTQTLQMQTVQKVSY